MEDTAKKRYYERNKERLKQYSKEYYAKKRAQQLAAGPRQRGPVGRPSGMRLNLKEKWIEAGRAAARAEQQAVENSGIIVDTQTPAECPPISNTNELNSELRS
jgi:hypothetical protein